MAQRYLVECYWPGVTQPAQAEAETRAETAATKLRGSGYEIWFLGALLVPQDEVVFFRFAATSRDAVERASTLAELPFERVTEYVESPDT